MSAGWKTLAALLCGVVVVPLLAVLAINATDEALEPDAAGFGEPRPTRIADADNGYLRIVALDAPPGADDLAWATAWLAESRAAAAEQRAERRDATDAPPLPTTCDPSEQSCLALAQASPTELGTAIEAHAEQLRRYEALLAAPAFEEVLDHPLRVNTGFPDYGRFGVAQRAWLAQAALAMQRGDLEAAVSALERDFALQRRIVSNARTVLARTVATVNYWRDLAFLADLVQRQGATIAPLLPRLQSLVADPEFLVAGQGVLVESEFAWGKALLLDPLAAPVDEAMPGLTERALFGLLYRPHATINREVRRLRAVAAALELPPARGSAALAAIGREYGEPRTLDYLVNPAGKLLLLLPVAAPGEDAYQRLRLYDTLGFARLVGVQIEAAVAGGTALDPRESPGRTGSVVGDPYSGEAFAWDPVARELSFEARSGALRTRELANAHGGRVFVRL